MKKLTSKLPAKPWGFLALVVVGSLLANRFQGAVMKAELKAKAKLTKAAA